MFELGALFKLSGMEFQNKAPLYLDEFLPNLSITGCTSSPCFQRPKHPSLTLIVPEFLACRLSCPYEKPRQTWLVTGP